MIAPKENPKWERAIVALLTYPTIGEAARSVDMGESTLLRWLSEPNFQAAYRETRRQCVESAIARLQQSACEAVTTLVTVMQDALTPASVRVSAAKTVLEQAYRGQEILDMEERLAIVETQLAAQEKKP